MAILRRLFAVGRCDLGAYIRVDANVGVGWIFGGYSLGWIVRGE